MKILYLILRKSIFFPRSLGGYKKKWGKKLKKKNG